jgi:hypothetical protein
MRCGQCQFENMPGLKRCFKCGSVLTDEEKVQVEPPRMPHWKKPWRSFLRSFRSARGPREKPAAANVMPGDREEREGIDWLTFADNSVHSLGYVLGSIVPGGGHLIQGRWRSVRLLSGIWLAAICGWLFFYRGAIGVFCLVAAAALHAWILTDIPDSEFAEQRVRRVGIMIGLCAIFSFAYGAMAGYLLHNIQFVQTTFAVEGKGVMQGDTVIARALADPNEARRGALVISTRATMGMGGHGNFFNYGRMEGVFGQVVGLAGDEVAVKGESFEVNGKPLKAGAYHVPQWFRGMALKVKVPPGSAFVTAEYDIQGHGVGLTPELVQSSMIVETKSITGLVVMKWLPVRRRGFLPEN